MSSEGQVLVFVSPLWTDKTLQLKEWLAAKGFRTDARALDVSGKSEMLPAVKNAFLRAWHKMKDQFGEVKPFDDFCAEILVDNLARTIVVHHIPDEGRLSDLNNVLNHGVTSFSALYLDREHVVVLRKAEDKALFLPKPVVL